MGSSRREPSVSRFFVQVLAALLFVNLASAAVLIYIAYTFSSDSLTKQAREAVSQQLNLFADSLVKQHLIEISTVLSALEINQDLEDYLQVSDAERLILARRIERQFIQIQKDNPDITGIYYFDEDGSIKVGAKGNTRLMIADAKELQQYDVLLLQAAPLFKRLSETPLLLSSGGMEWFIPPREAIVTGPLRRADGGYSVLSALAKLDRSTGLFGGMLLVHFKLDNWLSELAQIRILEQSPVWVYGSNGELILGPVEEKTQQLRLEPVDLPTTRQYSQSRLIDDANGLIAFRDIALGDDNSLRLVFSVPSKLLVKGLHPAIEFFSWVLLASVLLLVAVSFLISRLLVRPFKELAVARNNLMSAQRVARLGHWEWDKSGQVMHLSENAADILGFDKNQKIINLESLLQRIHEDDRIKLKQLFASALSHDEAVGLEYRMCHEDGSEHFIHQEIDVIDEQSARLIGTVQDISERRRSEARIRELAYHDSVTGLANRALLDLVAEHALQAAGLQKSKMAVLFLDLDQFKLVNDSLGHDAGDELLRQVADRLIESVRPSDTVSALPVVQNGESTVARLGGDEFIILLPNLIDSADALLVAERVRASLNKPFVIQGKEILSSGSLGISIYPDHADSVGDLLRKADTAMYFAKAQGRNRHILYNNNIDALQKNRLTIEVALSRALKNQEFELYYQPRFSIDGERILSFEALIRWNNPEKGLVMPDEFIYIAEENGMIVPIGEWVIETACRQLAIWQREFSMQLGMSVNLSPAQLVADNLVACIEKNIARAGIHSSSLELELTENALFKDDESSVRLLHELKALGVNLSIDDFGTGYSSLRLLSRLPVDTLKIDKSFVQDMLKDSDSEMIVHSFIYLGKNLGLKLVAEGVEELGQWLELKQQGCDEVQGYYFSRPCRHEAAEQLLVEQYEVKKAQ